MSPGREPGPRGKDRPIDPTSGMDTPASPSPNRFRALQADGRQPFMPRVSHNPSLLMLPFCFAHAMRMRPLSVGRVESAFHPAMDHYDVISSLCKEIAAMAAMMVNRNDTAGPYRLAVRGSA